MPRRAILLSVLACLCLAPDAALAAVPLTVRDATPGASGSQIDPSVASTPTGHRLVAATNANGATPSVQIWRRDGTTDPVWPESIAIPDAEQPSIAWDGGSTGNGVPTAQLATAPDVACTPATSNGAISIWKYTVATTAVAATDTLTPATGNLQSWPRMVLGDPADDVRPGGPIVAADQENCTTHDHDVVLAWQSDPGTSTSFFTRVVGHGRYPAVATLGSIVNGVTTGTGLAIAYLSEPTAGNEQDVLVRVCSVGGGTTTDCTVAASERVDTITPPGSVTAGAKTVAAVGAPSISCSAGRCHVVWTESAAGGSRTRVFYSTAVAPYTSWSSPVQVASASGSASQLMPSVAANGTRADIVYLDTRNGTFEAFQTSIAGAARSRDITLNGPAGYAPGGGASLGERTDVAEYNFPDAKRAVVSSYFPDANGGLGTVSEAELAHGTTAPTFPLLGTTQTIGKNTSFSVTNWLNWSDADGDPVTFSVDDPPHGAVTTVNGMSTYAADASYAGADSVTGRAGDGVFSQVVASHAVTVTNGAPELDAPAPAIVDEGGAVVTVPLHAVDPDINDPIVYSILLADSPLNSAGIATIVGNAVQIKVPAGVRALAPVSITVRARDTTTGSLPLYSDQTLSVTIRPDLATPITEIQLSDVRVTGVRASVTAHVRWNDPSNACLTTSPICRVRRVWNFGDGSASITTVDQPTLDHVFPRSGSYDGQVTTWVLWGSSQVASAPEAFNVRVQDDGRTIAAITPKPVVRLSKTKRQVRMIVTSRATGSVYISIKVGRKILAARQFSFVAGKPREIRLNVSIAGLHSRKATIRLYKWSMLASGVPPTDVYRPIILR